MNVKFKMAAYAVLLILVAWFGIGFYHTYTTVTKESAEPPPTTETNVVAATNAVPATNSTNSIDGTNATVAAATNAPAVAPAPVATPAPVHHSAHGTMIAYLAAFVGAIIGLGLLVAYDFTQLASNVAVDALFDDGGEGARDPEYEKAEQAWAAGKHLEAIEMMREFLKAHPREQYASLRIAEIYEKDLKNYLAAALEYEEVLKKKLPAERWGWAAIHLCNLYSKLGQQEKTRALLQRVVDDYPKTAAAKKARNRLGIAEPEPDPVAKEPETEVVGNPDQVTYSLDDDGEEETEAPAPAPAPKEPEAPKSNLPPGFRPKK